MVRTQGWEFAHSLIAHSLIRSFRSLRICSFAPFAQMKWATVSNSLRSLKTNERPRAICSGRSEEMSDVSKSLISLAKNERMSETLKKFWLKSLKSCFNLFFFKVFLNFEKISESLVSFFLVSE